MANSQKEENNILNTTLLRKQRDMLNEAIAVAEDENLSQEEKLFKFAELLRRQIETQGEIQKEREKVMSETIKHILNFDKEDCGGYKQ